MVERKSTYSVGIGSIQIGGGAPIAVQSMCATETQDVEATTALAALRRAGAPVVRVAVASAEDTVAPDAIRGRTEANLSVDLQESLTDECLLPQSLARAFGQQWIGFQNEECF